MRTHAIVPVPKVFSDLLTMSEEQRATLLSDEGMYSIVGVDDFGEWRVRPLKSPFEIRDFYEAKIASGELMVVKTVQAAYGDNGGIMGYSCTDCGAPCQPDYWMHCPGCGAKIIKS